VNAHAGEAAGAQSIWDAVRELGVERIGHGTRAWQDPGLVEYLIAHRIPVEMCPISNVPTGVVPCLRDHPIRHYFSAGMVVSVNTDDAGGEMTAPSDAWI
jgi:adenosine deaminase